MILQGISRRRYGIPLKQRLFPSIGEQVISKYMFQKIALLIIGILEILKNLPFFFPI